MFLGDCELELDGVRGSGEGEDLAHLVVVEAGRFGLLLGSGHGAMKHPQDANAITR